MDLPKANIAITGSNGLIGSHVLFKFCSEKIFVRAIVRDIKSAQKQIQQLFSYYTDEWDLYLKRIQFFEADLTDLQEMEHSLEGIDSIIHCAGIVSDSKKSRGKMMRINGRVTADLANAALEKNVKWFCHISSVAVFGGRLEKEIDESLFWKSAPGISDYAISKYAGEREIWRAMEEGLPAVILNPSVVAGPAKNNKQINRFIQYVTKQFPYYIDGTIACVDARDVAAIIYQLFLKGKTGERYIISSENISTKDMLSSACRALGLKEPVKEISGWKLSLLRLFYPTLIRSIQFGKCYSNKKISEELGFTFRPVKEAIENMVGIMHSGHHISSSTS